MAEAAPDVRAEYEAWVRTRVEQTGRAYQQALSALAPFEQEDVAAKRTRLSTEFSFAWRAIVAILALIFCVYGTVVTAIVLRTGKPWTEPWGTGQTAPLTALLASWPLSGAPPRTASCAS